MVNKIFLGGKSTLFFDIEPSLRFFYHGNRTKILPDRSGAAAMEASASPQMLVAGVSWWLPSHVLRASFWLIFL